MFGEKRGDGGVDELSTVVGLHSNKGPRKLCVHEGNKSNECVGGVRFTPTAVTVLTWSRRSYLPRSTRISILHLVKLEALRLSVTGTWVRTLATFTAGEDEAGSATAVEEPSAGVVETERAPMVPRPRAGAVASDRAPLVALLAAGEVVIVS
jgi:hypothetical protein